jgi:transposase
MIDRRPDNTGLDDGPPLLRASVNSWKRTIAIDRRSQGIDLRTIATQLDVSHETIRVWTRGVNVRRGKKP